MKKQTKDRIQVWLMSSGMFLIGFACGSLLTLGVWL